MSEERSGGSNAVALAYAVVGVLLAYVASIGPLEGLTNNGTLPDPPPRWLQAFYAPLNVVDGTPLEKPLMAYVVWWCHALEKP